ncbi:uncharacterized protein LOC142327363 isoform X2 [Lycorma delicatula]|uniref:uncharacterized protein LOC142327363 isoform X2 n=1 Tax=Lycorma delicatula TaxID=130591 RepID=UPI003F5169CC
MMCCNPDDIVGNLLLLDLPFVNVLRERIVEFNNVLFNQSEERRELLCEIISFIDNDLKLHLANIEKDELENELIQFYFGLGFIKKSEEPFISGNMGIAEQCNVWSNVISCLKGLQSQPSLNEKYENCNQRLIINKIIHNPAFKETLNKRITVVNNVEFKKNLININNIREELLEINNSINELNEILLSHEEDIDESSAPLSVTEELKKSDHETVHILLTEWVNNIKSRGSFHHDMNYVAHFSQLSSGYESDHDESNFEDSFHKDFSAKILLLYNNFYL